jgi:dsRNA-specific ribonuclease
VKFIREGYNHLFINIQHRWSKNMSTDKSFRKKHQPLLKALSYQNFQRVALLKQALTRTSAIHEKNPDAAAIDFERLEFLGDKILNSIIAKILYEQMSQASPQKLHEACVPLIANDGVLLQVAKQLNLARYLITGRGEKEKITDLMLAQAMEALLAAVYLDSKNDKNVTKVIKRLWGKYFPIPIHDQKKAVTPSNRSKKKKKLKSKAVPALSFFVSEKRENSALSVHEPLTPRTQRVFSGVGGSCPPEKFKQYVQRMPNVNGRNIGKKGDTTLMMLLRKKKIREMKEFPKIQSLLKAGALWTVQNNRGETADDLAKKHNPELIRQLKLTY